MFFFLQKIYCTLIHSLSLSLDSIVRGPSGGDRGVLCQVQKFVSLLSSFTYTGILYIYRHTTQLAVCSQYVNSEAFVVLTGEEAQVEDVSKPSANLRV